MMMVAGFYIHPAEKSQFFVIYYRCVTLADGMDESVVCLVRKKDIDTGNSL